MSTNKKIGIYKITNIINNKCYIGQTINYTKRLSSHKISLANNTHQNTHLQSSYNKYGKKVFEFKLIFLCNIQDLDTSEKHFIQSFKSYDRLFGYNNELGGNLKKIVSENTRKKISLSNRGRISPWKGRHASLETRKKQSDAKKGKISPNKGKKMSPEACKNIGLSKLGKSGDYKMPIYQINIHTNNIITEWKSMTLASRTLNINCPHICMCCKGNRNFAGGYKWCYVKDYTK